VVLRWGKRLTLVWMLVLTVPATAPAGPVILGGDDLTDHGQQDAGVNEDGWLYMEKAVGNIKPNVTRPNDDSIAALGSEDADPATEPGNAGAAIKAAANANGMSVDYFNGEAAISGALADIANGSYNPAIVWVAGDGATNDLGDTGCEGPGTEGQAITDNAGTINAFVSEGGGLMAHSTCYQWLSTLLPTVTTVDGGSSDDLYLTPQGHSAFPGLTNTDVNAGPWHSHFEGDFGGLRVLARSGDIDDATGTDAAVILGGAAVNIVPPSPPVPGQAACANFVPGSPAQDTLAGTDGNDLVKGLQGNDHLDGGNGDDCVRGGPGSDQAEGGQGNDQVNGGQRPDSLSGGPGDDLVKAVAGTTRDVIACGPGTDTARVEKRDVVKQDCERVRFAR
jgi:Ca2+-binding RTX toxin-like protein